MNITFEDLLQFITPGGQQQKTGSESDTVSTNTQETKKEEKQNIYYDFVKTQGSDKYSNENQQVENTDFLQSSFPDSQNNIPFFGQGNFFDQKNPLQTDTQNVSETTKEQKGNQVPITTVATNDLRNFTFHSSAFQEPSNTIGQSFDTTEKSENKEGEKEAFSSGQTLSNTQQFNSQQFLSSQEPLQNTSPEISIPDFKPMHIVFDDLISTKNQEQKSLGENVASTSTFDSRNNSFDFNSVTIFDSEKNLQTSNISVVSLDGSDKKNLSQKSKKTKIWLVVGITVVGACFGFFYLFVTRPLLFDSVSTYRGGSSKLSEEYPLQTPLADSIEKNNTTGDSILSLLTGEEQNSNSEKENITDNMQASPREILSTESNSENTGETLVSDSISSLKTTETQNISSGIVQNILSRLEKMEQSTIKIITHAQAIQEKKFFIKGQLLLRNIAKFKNDIQSMTDIDTGFVMQSLNSIQKAIEDMQQQLGISSDQSSESFSQNLSSN